MAKQKSDFVSALGIAFEFIKALAEEVYALNGNDDHIRRALRERQLMRDFAKTLVGQGDTRIFTCRVDKSDRAFQPFDKGEFAYVESDLKPEHYPLKGAGVQDRKFKIINLWERFPDHDPTTQELVDLVKAEGEDPDFADTKAFLRDNPAEATNEHPLISLCGSVVSRRGSRYVAAFLAYSDERGLGWDWLGNQGPRDCRLLVAC